MNKNEIDIKVENSYAMVAKDNGAVVGRLTVDGAGKEKEIWILEGYETYAENIKRGLRQKALSVGILKE